MKYRFFHTPRWFTLVELLVAITIFSIMMIAVLSVFLFSSQMSGRIELDRSMQENVKSVMEDIAEGVRKNEILGLREVSGNCSMLDANHSLIQGNILCLDIAEYALWTYEETTDLFLPISDTEQCKEIQISCQVLKKNTGGEWYPLSNSFAAIETLDFTLSNSLRPKLSVQFSLRPSAKKGVPIQTTQENKLVVQSSFSTRIIETQ